ncbi:MAG: HD-GYP domain-containing protein [Anaerolineales bacterium]
MTDGVCGNKKQGKYDAITSDRPYRKAYSKEEAKQIILSLKGKQFDPKLTELFLEIIGDEDN